ncbi:uncharacterized protein KQ657_003693 [Scheffersomyces spartinae]|uniref:Protein CWH43 n=1 Tax=Scheffersomyces spartinae TaxID=45513 RepID=A0A9P7VBZ3_9ASCO|nr:uncharacterized protein KQ657_003693 [Scheffersomyces spartinae]KAG7195169.1 hypothetical protein KQ657_003693 [Scheffersomyces spartinae]
MAESSSNLKPVITVNASFIGYAHTVFAIAPFVGALIVGCWLHYEKIVRNSSFGYPDEWFPSVSATIGDRYPERSLFQVLIAVCSGPRFLLLFFNFVAAYKPKSVVPYIALVSGLLRTLTCGGWVYITSTDDHDWHDIFMISYIILTIPWDICTTLGAPKGSCERKGRFYTGWLFFLMLIPLVYWFIQHKVHVVAGAYSVYAYFEWALILLDVSFDGWSILGLQNIEIGISGNGLHFTKVQPSKDDKATSIETIESKLLENTVVSLNYDFTCFEFIINVINAYMFWTNVTALVLCVWYFPLWHMGISGYEAAIGVTIVAPILVVLPFIRAFFTNVPFLSRFIGVLLGVGVYKVEDPELRLLILSVGTFFSTVAYITESYTWSKLPTTSKYISYHISFIIGLLATSTFKFLNYSNNPIWPIMNETNGGYNEVGLAIGLTSAFLTPMTYETTESHTSPAAKHGFLLFAALGFAGYYFSLHALLSDSGTLASWTWSGYPINGPTPISGSLPFFGAMIVGILASLGIHPNVFSSTFYNAIVGGGSAFTLYSFPDWAGYCGALVYAFYLSSLSGLIAYSVIGHNVGVLYFFGFFFETVLALASVWIVAYAFVPGGPLLRERTDLILLFSFTCIQFGVLNYTLKAKESKIVRFSFETTKTFKQALAVLTTLLALSITGYVKRYPIGTPTPYNDGSGSFTAGIWCIHFGLDNDMWSSETRMLDLIRDAQVDVIGLLESDTQRLIGGNRDFTQKIAEDLGMYVDYGPGPNKHTWGAALLSKFPILKSEHHLLPSPVGELAPAIHATLDIYGQEVDIVVFHLGQEEDVEDRRLQSLGISDIMGKSTNPLVLLSYLVTEPGQGNYNTYVSENSNVWDIDSTDWDRWCEYILFRDLKKVAYARISRSTITDTELQVAKFKLLSDEEKNQYDIDFLYGNHFIDESEVPENLRMPQLLRGEGVRGHFYHVFDEPRYFALSKDSYNKVEESQSWDDVQEVESVYVEEVPEQEQDDVSTEEKTSIPDQDFIDEVLKEN